MDIREDKPAWSAVPASVKARTEEILGAHVTRAVRAFGGYGPSATFLLSLDDGRRAFFKGVYPLPEGSAVRWSLEEEERVYTSLGDVLAPWAPAYYGSVRSDGWHALVIEAVAGDKVPPWSPSQAERAARSYAQFHAATRIALPEWLPRDQHLEFATFWTAIAGDDEATDRIVALCQTPQRRRAAATWLDAHIGSLVAAEKNLVNAGTSALLHFDTRSDNVRLDGNTLRIFDWPFACVGPPEFDLGAFAQSIAGEGGPDPEMVARAYSAVLPADESALTASVVGLSGYFAERGSRPELPGLPRLRRHQRRQLRSSLSWAARRLELPPAAWLDDLVD